MNPSDRDDSTPLHARGGSGAGVQVLGVATVASVNPAAVQRFDDAGVPIWEAPAPQLNLAQALPPGETFTLSQGPTLNLATLTGGVFLLSLTPDDAAVLQDALFMLRDGLSCDPRYDRVVALYNRLNPFTGSKEIA